MKRAGDVLSAFFDERLMKKARGYSKLFASWAELTQKNGIPAAADHSRIRELDRGILRVEADHPGWVQILQTRESRLLDDFRRRFPDLDISGISLILSRSGQSSGGTEDVPEQPAAVIAAPDEPVPLPEAAALPPGPEEQFGYDSIKDEDFKESLKRLEQSIAAKKM
jgi:hypothetical protein